MTIFRNLEISLVKIIHQAYHNLVRKDAASGFASSGNWRYRFK